VPHSKQLRALNKANSVGISPQKDRRIPITDKTKKSNIPNSTNAGKCLITKMPAVSNKLHRITTATLCIERSLVLNLSKSAKPVLSKAAKAIHDNTQGISVGENPPKLFISKSRIIFQIFLIDASLQSCGNATEYRK
jgi:hypothetical protein